MNKYFTTEVVTVNGQTSIASFERADLNTAKSAYHSIMASAMANENCTEALVMVFDSNGGFFINDHFIRQ